MGRMTQKFRSPTRRKQWLIAGGLILSLTVLFLALPASVRAEGASLKMSPAAGTYEVGGLVDVSFIVDTGGQAINAVQADILFPADKMQVVNPVASTSFI